MEHSARSSGADAGGLHGAAGGPAGADPETDNGCEVVLTAEEGASGPLAAELTWACANFEVEKILLVSESGKEIIAGPFDTEGQGTCTPDGADAATCRYLQGSEAGVIPISALDVCGTDDNDPLVLDVTLEELITLDGDSAEPADVQIQCTAAPPGGGGTTTTTPTTTTPPPSASGTPGGTGGGAGGGSGGADNGQVPVGGVQSGAGGTAPADDGGAGLLAAVVGLMLAATLGLGIARVRSVRG